jgi:3',5'-cyclic AMP phosphodiesterase CpdA
MAVSDAASERDGLLIARSTSVLLRLLDDLAAFARGGGDGAIHLGDAVCGGGGFNQSADVYTSSLRWLRAMETRAAGNWPIHHVPGNHDLSPAGGGLRAWETTMAATCIRDSSSPEESIATCDVDGGSQPGADASPIYRSLLTSHQDGHGHIGRAQLDWLTAELEAAQHGGQKVVLLMHQLLMDPTGPAAMLRNSARRGKRTPNVLAPEVEVEEAGSNWIGFGDMIDNRKEVLALITRFPGVVRLSLHGHVHANTLVHAYGVAFATLSSTSEYPMQWHELQLDACEARLLQRPLDLAEERRLSALRDTRPGHNRVKLGFQLGATMGERVVVPTCL